MTLFVNKDDYIIVNKGRLRIILNSKLPRIVQKMSTKYFGIVLRSS